MALTNERNLVVTKAVFRITPYIAFVASGSEISTNEESGYEPGLTRELQRVGVKGGNLVLNAPELRDLAEFCETLAISDRDSGNMAGARSLNRTAELAREEAFILDGAYH